MRSTDRMLSEPEARYAEESMRESEARYLGLLELSSEPIVLHSGGVFIRINDSAAMLFGANDCQELIGRSVGDFLFSDAGGSPPEEAPGPKSTFVPARLVRLDGSEVAVVVAEHHCRLRGEAAVQAVIHDASSRQMAFQAQNPLRFDALTGLPNRSQFLERLSAALGRGLRQQKLVGLLMINLDRFKDVDRTAGAPAADLVLKRAAERLKRLARRENILGRVGGDEFAMILEDLVGPDGVASAAARIVECISQPLQIAEGQEIVITASIGCVVASGDSVDPDTLMRNSDVAMGYAKDRGGNTYEIYTPELGIRKDREDFDRRRIEQRFALLTPREREVMDLLASGKANKMVAYLLGTSTRTVENHRASIMEKMQAASLAELVRMVLDRRRAGSVALSVKGRE